MRSSYFEPTSDDAQQGQHLMWSSILKQWTNRKSSVTDVLVVTPDDRFFSSLLYVTDQKGWRLRWSKTVERATDLLTQRFAPVVVYDCRMTVAGWETGVLTLAIHKGRPAVIMAVPFLDEAIWHRGLEHGAYDVVCRSGDRSPLLATMRFALHRRNRQMGSQTADGLLVTAHPAS